MIPYYYVYKYGDQGPRVRHTSMKEAQDEAERLAVKEPGQCFEILQCLGYSSTSKASTFWMDGDEPPETPRYRMLENGEQIQAGDQFTRDDGETWAPASDVGTDYRKRSDNFSGVPRFPHFPHRRPL